jgi:hypothetical protein
MHAEEDSGIQEAVEAFERLLGSLQETPAAADKAQHHF